MPLDPSIPLNAIGANPQQPQQQMSNALQVFQLKDAMQQRDMQQKAQINEKLVAKKLDAMLNRGTGLWVKYQTLKDNGFSEQAATAAMQEDWKRELGGLASERDERGAPLFGREELAGLGDTFNSGQLGSALAQMMGAKHTLDAYFKNREFNAKGSEATSDMKEYKFAQSQGFKGSLQDWIVQNKKAGATTVNVNTGNMPLTKSNVNAAQKDVAFSMEQLGNLDAIAKDYEDGFLTYGGKVKNFVDRQTDKIDPTSLPKEDRAALGKQTRFKQQVNRGFNAYRKEITGAAAAMAELERLKEAMLNTDLSPTEFRAAFDSYQTELKRSLRLKRKLLREGISVADEDFGQRYDQAFASGMDDDAMARGEELEAAKTPDEQIVETLRQEGYID